MSETPYQTLKRRGAQMAEIPLTIDANLQAAREVYVAKVDGGVRIGVLHEQGETSFVIPCFEFGKLSEIVKSWK